MKLGTLCFALLFLPILLMAQRQDCKMKSKVVDSLGAPIDAVTCIIQELESPAEIKVVISDETGVLIFDKLMCGTYKLTLQHLSYKKNESEITIQGDSVFLPFIMENSETYLSEILVKAEKPFLKTQNGKMIYDISQLRGNKIATNAFDAVKLVPNIMSSGENDLQLVATSEFNILIDGQLTNMSREQLVSMLKSMPADRIVSIEVMYSTPPQYNVRGSSVNIVLANDKKNIPELQGEGSLVYKQAKYAGFKESVSLLYTKPSYNIDFSLGLNQNKSYSHSRFDARHTLENNQVYNIREDKTGKNSSNYYNIRLNGNYVFKNKDKLLFSYISELGNYNSKPKAYTSYTEQTDPFYFKESRSKNTGDDYLHNVKLSYSSLQLLNISLVYTSYKDPSTSLYMESGDKDKYSYKTWTRQKIDKMTFNADHSLKFEKGWVINYGGRFSYSTNNNDYNFYSDVESSSLDSSVVTKEKEYIGNVFAGFSKSIGEKLSLQASVSANYFKATTKLGMDSRKDLWDEFYPFFNANINYNQSSALTYQLAFSSDARYPSYWYMSGDVVQTSSYSFVRGNPNLKFSRIYNTRLLLILKKKYMLILSNEYTPDYFVQQPYQSPEVLHNIFEFVNFDYRKTYSASFVVPFAIENIVNSRLTMSLFHQRQKDSDFHDIPFKRTQNSFTVYSTNTFTISSKPDIKIDLTAFYMHGALQGVYDVKHMSNISSTARWRFLNKKAELSVNVNDIFNGNNSKTVVDYKGQKSSMKIYSNTPSVQLTFIYRFGSYKQKNDSDVDTSRFNRE